MKKVENEEKEIISRLEGKIEYEIEFTEDTFANKFQVSNENNFIALVMVRDMLTSVIKNQAIPTLTAKQKMPKNILAVHLDARNLLESLVTGLGSHLLREVKNNKIKPKIDVVKPSIILPGK